MTEMVHIAVMRDAEDVLWHVAISHEAIRTAMLTAARGGQGTVTIVTAVEFTEDVAEPHATLTVIQ